MSHPRWTEDINDWPLPPIIKDYGSTLRDIQRVFEARHLIAHELPTEKIVKDSEVGDLLTAAVHFISACDWVVVDELQGSVAKTQTQMNVDADASLAELVSEMAELLTKIENLPNVDVVKLQKAQEAWTSFADCEAALAASWVDGGSMYPMVWASARADLVEDRIDQLTDFLKEAERHLTM